MTHEDLENTYREGCRCFFERAGDGSRAGAEEIFLDIIRRDPSHHQALNMLGLCHQARAEHATARRFFQQAIDACPRGIYYLNLGISLANDERWPEALEAMESAIGLEPLNPTVNFNFGQVQYALGRLDEAEASWRRTYAIDPTYQGIHVHLALALLEGGRLPEAERILKQGLKRFPGEDEMYQALSQIYEATGRHRQGAALWGAYLRRNPKRRAERLGEAREHQQRFLALARKGPSSSTGTGGAKAKGGVKPNRRRKKGTP